KQTVQSDVLMTTSTPSVFLENLSKKYNIPIIINPVCEGIASDWSFAYNSCRTKYVTLAHQDDLYFHKYCELCLCAVKGQKDNVITFTDYYELIKDKFVGYNLHLLIKKILLTPFLLKRNIAFPFIKRTILSFGNAISCPTVMYNKERIGFFKFSEKFKCNVDWDAWFRLSGIDGSFAYVDKKIMAHRMHKESEAYLLREKGAREKEDQEMLEKFWPKKIARIMAFLYRFNLKLN
ncbi:MAG: glycosyltransferase family 2 protein, partial [Candidatus Omnitrophica bacterium]|nr:glycosyltransferase family 2 protein [Candidatus Omnitrophota bacterium]